MAQWGARSKAGKSPSKGDRGSADGQRGAAGTWQQSAPGRRAVTAEAIAKRAYERWLARGGNHGDDQRDWFEAERELWAKAGRNTN